MAKHLKIGEGIGVYYTFKNKKLILLLVGGDKSSQSKDIEKAKKLVEGMGE